MAEEPILFPPSSPGKSRVLSELMEDVLKFLLSSSVSQTLEIDLNLSKDYCSNLLKDDDDDDDLGPHSNLHHLDTFGGVPVYPLYKRLALALQQGIASGASSRTTNITVPFQEDDSLKSRKETWTKLIVEKGGYDLVNMLKAVDYEIHVQEPFFSQLRVGLKTVEGRCALGDYNRLSPGVLLLFNKCLVLQVQGVTRYASFSEMLDAETLERVLPGVETIAEGLQIYRNFYTEEKEHINGVVAIRVSEPPAQPYITLANIVSGLSYEGIGSFLGLMRTVGTVPDALPPPRSTLLSSFHMPHKPNVTGSTLTEGARALAKHVERASSGWWGSFDGNDSNKNELASRVIHRLITHCSWINVHVVRPHGDIFEIRVSEGYGARWTKDGSKFIGFVEPHMEDGHHKGWKH